MMPDFPGTVPAAERDAVTAPDIKADVRTRGFSPVKTETSLKVASRPAG
jgi:hypothetical protein